MVSVETQDADMVKKLAMVIQHLSELRKGKQMPDSYPNIATVLSNQIKKGRLDGYFQVEEKSWPTKFNKERVIALIQGWGYSNAGATLLEFLSQRTSVGCGASVQRPHERTRRLESARQISPRRPEEQDATTNEGIPRGNSFRGRSQQLRGVLDL